jgi:hypothetical protein
MAKRPLPAQRLDQQFFLALRQIVERTQGGAISRAYDNG